MLQTYFVLIYAIAVIATNGCQPTSKGGSGFLARFYEYRLRSENGWRHGFFQDGYKYSDIGRKHRLEPLHEVLNLENFIFQHSNQPDRSLIDGKIYGQDITISNYTLELSGYFKAPYTTEFNFTLAADNGASLQFGAGQTCCDDAAESVTGQFSIDTLGPKGGGGSTSVNIHWETFNLTQDVYYPVKIVMFNWQGNNGLNLTVIDKDGREIPDLGQKIFQAKFDSKCSTRVTSVWAKTYSTTTTMLGEKTNTVLVNIPKETTVTTTTWNKSYMSSTTATGSTTNTVIIEVPTPTTTTTEYWDNRYISSLLKKGKAGESNTVVIQVPKSLTTTTKTWDETYRSATTAVGSTTNTIIIGIPTPTQTVTSYWTGNHTTSTTVVGGPGENNTVTVEVPKWLTTTTSTWTGAYNDVAIRTGNETNTVVIRVPTPTVTETSFWTGNHVTSRTVTGAKGGNNTLIIDIPKWLTTTTSTWTGSYTELTTNTGSETNTVIVEVPIPTQTVTSFWSGSYITSTTVTGAMGENNILVNEVPQIKSVSNELSSWDPNSLESAADSMTVEISDAVPTKESASLVGPVSTADCQISTLSAGGNESMAVSLGIYGNETSTFVPVIPTSIHSKMSTFSSVKTTMRSFTTVGSISAKIDGASVQNEAVTAATYESSEGKGSGEPIELVMLTSAVTKADVFSSAPEEEMASTKTVIVRLTSSIPRYGSLEESVFEGEACKSSSSYLVLTFVILLVLF